MAEHKNNVARENNEARADIEEIVGTAVANALQAQIPQLQAQIVQQVLRALPAPGAIAQGQAPSPEGSTTNGLVQAVAQIHAGTTQKEILRALLDAGSQHCARIALFVVKAGAASGWQARGFADDDGVKDFPLDLHAGPAAHSYQNRIATPGNIAEMGGQFVDHFGRPANEQVLLLPLALKDKVAALVYADGGESGQMAADALELLVITTSAWLEVVSLRKTAAPREDIAPPPPPPPPAVEKSAAPVQTVSSFSDPFASHAPKHVPAKVVADPAPAAEVVEVATAHAAAAPAAATDPLAGLSPEDADTHRKAQRFARLLVDEIKLYNQAKVAEGRRNKDLYDRLKEDIEKSRGTWQKRYGTTVAASADYFQTELVRSLAEDDLSVMGANFRR
jgi:hypothetical protein